jgi:hypothetical protein
VQWVGVDHSGESGIGKVVQPLADRLTLTMDREDLLVGSHRPQLSASVIEVVARLPRISLESVDFNIYTL